MMVLRRRATRCVVAIGFVVVCVLAGSSVSALALSAGPGWEVGSHSYPTDLAPGGSGIVAIDVYDIGAAVSGSGATVTDTLPRGVTATSQTGPGMPALEWTCSAGTPVTCTAELPSTPVGVREEAEIEVSVEPSASEGKFPNAVTVTGGGAPSPASTSDLFTVASATAGFGFASTDAWFSNANGTLDRQAGSHPYEFTVNFELNTERGGGAIAPVGGEEARNVDVNLPPGLVGNPTAVPQCTRQQFDSYECPAGTQVGVDYAGLLGGEYGLFTLRFSVFNMVPPPGSPAEFAFNVLGKNVFLDVGVRSGGDYGITVHSDHLPQEGIMTNTTTIWGVPSEPSHDAQRCALVEDHELCGVSSNAARVAFLTLPTSCAGPLTFSLSAQAWREATRPVEASSLSHDSSGAPVGITGCERLGFGPALTIAPDTSAADTPAGLTTEINVPQEGLSDPESVATSNVRDGTVVLPEGIVISPGRATGLVLCPLGEDGVGREARPSCPAASQVGTAQVTTPLLRHPLEGKVYVLQSAPPDVKLLVAFAGEGVEVKLVGDVTLNPTTGQLTTTFKETPELPFTNFKLSFSGGAQAALATPTGCGTFTSTSDFTAWSSPFIENVFPSSAFQITSGPGGSACASPLPFSPSMIAGATSDQAGGYTGFSMLLTRGDGQQRISKLQFKTPEGLLGMISHVSLCEEPQAAKGECPASSQIGHTVVGAGPGPYQLYVPQAGAPEAPIYIGGSYEGAPYSLVIAVPVIAGPFNLGTTVVRGRIEVDPQTSQLTITTDPLPRILDGVPVDLRTIDAVIDRPEFMFNPTNCDAQSFSGTATSTEGATAALSSSFQVGSCRSLVFKPQFKVSTSAQTSRIQGASLHVSLDLPDEGGLSSEANVQRVKVSLPKQLPSPLKTLQKACLEETFAENPKDCPVASQVGTVRVSTPVLPGGLSGTAYFVSHGGAKYPELIMVLVGQNGVTVQVHGETFISKAGITTATFAAVPDVPFSSFELTLPEREYPALTANGSLCKGTLIMPTEMVAQNGLVIDQGTKIAVTGCPKVKQATHKRRDRAHGKPKKGSKR